MFFDGGAGVGAGRLWGSMGVKECNIKRRNNDLSGSLILTIRSPHLPPLPSSFLVVVLFLLLLSPPPSPALSIVAVLSPHSLSALWTNMGLQGPQWATMDPNIGVGVGVCVGVGVGVVGGVGVGVGVKMLHDQLTTYDSRFTTLHDQPPATHPHGPPSATRPLAPLTLIASWRV